MDASWVTVIFLTALIVPLLLIWQFEARAWYWHLTSVALALALGLVPTPQEWKTPAFDVFCGFCFIFLMVWGIGGLFPMPTHHGHGGQHHHPV